MDERIARGMARQFEHNAVLMYDGARRLGWKAWFSTKPAMEVLEVDRPLVGSLTDATLIRSGSSVDLEDWGTPILECEIAVRMGADVPGDATRDAAAAAVDAVAPAIELVDLDLDVVKAGVEAVLAGNIFHRAVVLGAWDTGRAGLRLDGLRVTVEGSAADVQDADPLEATGDIGEIVRNTAETLAEVGDGLRAGDAIITGIVSAPAPLRGGQRVTVSFSTLEPLTLEFFA